MDEQIDISNAVQHWIDNDQDLSNTLVRIEETGLSVKEQAEQAFHKISDMYCVPKLPENIQEDDTDDDHRQTSVYEELGLLKYLYPDDDLRGLVLLAIYLVKNKLHADDSVIDKSSISGIGYKGENSDVKLVLVQKGESWFDLGCKLFTQEV